jgi:hypothetical protein
LINLFTSFFFLSLFFCLYRKPIGRPLDVDVAIQLCAAELLRLIQRPKVDLSGKVAKATNHRDLREWADSYCVPIAFAELKKRFAVFVIECSRSGLHDPISKPSKCPFKKTAGSDFLGGFYPSSIKI